MIAGALQRIVVNVTGKIRRDTLHGRPHLVAPVTMIVPGVLNGSKGPLLYTREEIKRDPSIWNGVPITVYHPMRNGSNVSARDPDILNAQGIGTVLRSQANGKLTAEAWIDIEVVRRIDNRILEMLEKGRPIELSTGLFVEAEPAPDGATFNGRPFHFVARNFRPDHLAILPDQIGACSINDGCGVLINKEPKQMPLTEEQRTELVNGLIANCSCWEEGDRDTLVAFSDEKLSALNAMSEKAIASEKAENEMDEEMKEKTEEEMKNKGKAANNQQVSVDEWLASAPPEAQQVYNSALKMQEEQKDAIIAKLTANLDGTEKHDQRARLQQRTIEELRGDLALFSSLPQAQEQTTNQTDEKDAEWMTSVMETVTRNSQGEDEPLMLPEMGSSSSTHSSSSEQVTHSSEDYLRSAPKSLKTQIQKWIAREQDEKRNIIDQLTANIESSSRRMQMQDYLENKSLDDLQYLVEMWGVQKRKPAANYSGAAAPAANRSTLKDDEKDDILPLPSMAG